MLKDTRPTALTNINTRVNLKLYSLSLVSYNPCKEFANVIMLEIKIDDNKKVENVSVRRSKI